MTAISSVSNNTVVVWCYFLSHNHDHDRVHVHDLCHILDHFNSIGSETDSVAGTVVETAVDREAADTVVA